MTFSTFPCVLLAAMNDFNLLSNTVTFQDNARENDRACFQVLIIGDNFIETDETFHVNLSTNFPDILGDPNSATVTVRHDGDGKNKWKKKK